MAIALTLTLHGLKIAASDMISGQSLNEDRYTLTTSQYKSLLEVMEIHPSCTVSESLGKAEGSWIVLTFDDGLISDYELAFPHLNEKGLKATFFISVENIGKPGYMNLAQIRELASGGMEIGSHGLYHRYLVTLSKSDAQKEIHDSKSRLEQFLGLEVRSYAPVGGHYSSWMLDSACHAGYQAFASMVPGQTSIRPNSGVHFFRRNHVQSHHDFTYISALIHGEKKVLLINQIRYNLLALPKQLLGLNNYDRLKNFLIGKEADKHDLS